jgi:RNA polymerase sigma factor (sigma-70 family)
MAKEYFVVIDGEKVLVSEELYHAFKRPLWAERKRREVRAEKERSLDAFMYDGFDIPSEQALVEEIAMDKLLLEMLMAALAELTDDERSLINALFYDEKSEREVADEIGLSQKAVNKRRHRILEKLRNLMGL